MSVSPFPAFARDDLRAASFSAGREMLLASRQVVGFDYKAWNRESFMERALKTLVALRALTPEQLRIPKKLIAQAVGLSESTLFKHINWLIETDQVTESFRAMPWLFSSRYLASKTATKLNRETRETPKNPVTRQTPTLKVVQEAVQDTVDRQEKTCTSPVARQSTTENTQIPVARHSNVLKTHVTRQFPDTGNADFAKEKRTKKENTRSREKPQRSVAAATESDRGERAENETENTDPTKQPTFKLPSGITTLQQLKNAALKDEFTPEDRCALYRMTAKNPARQMALEHLSNLLRRHYRDAWATRNRASTKAFEEVPTLAAHLRVWKNAAENALQLGMPVSDFIAAQLDMCPKNRTIPPVAWLGAKSCVERLMSWKPPEERDREAREEQERKELTEEGKSMRDVWVNSYKNELLTKAELIAYIGEEDYKDNVEPLMLWRNWK